MQESTVLTKSMYLKIYAILDYEEGQLAEPLSKLLDELASTYKKDTGKTPYSEA